MVLFLVFFEVSGSIAAVWSPKSGYPIAEALYFYFELLFLVASVNCQLSDYVFLPRVLLHRNIA